MKKKPHPSQAERPVRPFPLRLGLCLIFLVASPITSADPAGDALARGLAYEHGKGAPQSYVEAAKWYLKAAKLGNPDAQYGVALLSSTGKGTPQDIIRAYIWANIAVANGADKALRLRLRMGEQIPPPMLLEAQRLATRCHSVSYAECP
jgi:TPR repeat protein